MLEHAIRPPSERFDVAFSIDREAVRWHAVDVLDAGWVLVAPGDIVPRTSRQHTDLRVASEVLRYITRVQLGAAIDVGAVALHDDSQLHWPVSGPSSPSEPGPESESEADPESSSSKLSALPMAASAVVSPCGG